MNTKWNSYRIKDICTYIGSGTTPKSSNLRYYENGIHNWVNTGDLNDDIVSECKQQITDIALRDYPTLRFYPKNTIIDAMYGATIGKVGMLDFEAVVNQACCAMVINKKIALPKFVLYYLIYYKPQLVKESLGGTQPNVNQFKVSNICIAMPSVAGQQTIVDYLDTKLSEIDRQVSLLTRKRDAYLRLKKSIINHAVTKGLNPNAKMKDSGIEWIGQVPEQWEVKRLKDCVDCNIKSLGEDTKRDKAIQYVEISDVTYANGIENVQNLTFGEAPSRARRITKKGDVIVSTVRTYLKAIAKIEEENIIVSTGFAVLHPTKCDGSFLSYYVLADAFLNKVEIYSKGTSYPAINASDLVTIHIPLPPLSEQHSIAAYLDDKCGKIDSIVANLNKQISRYGDLKRSLIDEVITGKRAV
jgi:type I restriction enzyme, S subunit